MLIRPLQQDSYPSWSTITWDTFAFDVHTNLRNILFIYGDVFVVARTYSSSSKHLLCGVNKTSTSRTSFSWWSFRYRFRLKWGSRNIRIFGATIQKSIRRCNEEIKQKRNSSNYLTVTYVMERLFLFLFKHQKAHRFCFSLRNNSKYFFMLNVKISYGAIRSAKR